MINVFSELNSIGAGFRAPGRFISRSPEKIITEALRLSLDEPMIPAQVMAVLTIHGSLFRKAAFKKEIAGLLKDADSENFVAVLFVYGVLAKTNLFSDSIKADCEYYLKHISPAKQLKSRLLQLEKMTLTLAKADPDLKPLGFLIPEISSAPPKSIPKSPSAFYEMNARMKLRVCPKCELGNDVKPMKHHQSLAELDGAKKLKGHYHECSQCGRIPHADLKRISKEHKKLVAGHIRERLFRIKRKRRIDDKTIAIDLGISPEHLSSVKHGRHAPSATLLKLIEIMAG